MSGERQSNNREQETPSTLPPAVSAGPQADYGATIRLGLWVLVLGFGGFLAWASLAQLDEGVPSPGVVSVESKRKRIDHLSGGIVENIAVHEGQKVRAGDALITLNETQVKASLNATQSQWRIAKATEARLKAERSGSHEIVYPSELLDKAKESEFASTLRAQSELFRSRRAALQGELAIIAESVRGLELQLHSLDQLLAGHEKQIYLFNEQLASYVKLNAQGFVSRNHLLDMERQLAEVQSKQSEDLANIASVKARLAEFRMRGKQREIEYRREVETQLAEVQRDVATLTERMAALSDTYQRLVIRAPVNGTVVDLAVHTIGGTVKPGDRIMDIVPEGDELIVEAQLAPLYIDRVQPGMLADVRFDAYMTARSGSPIVSGSVMVVSADALTDSRSGVPYYAIRIRVPPTEIGKLGGLQLQPGMQATVVIKTGERTLLVYLLRPLLRRFGTALGEQ